MFTANQDYCDVSKNHYTIPAGSTSSQDISIIIIDDWIVEGNESLIVIMELVDNPDLQAKLSTGGINEIVVTIQDNDSTCLNKPLRREQFGSNIKSSHFVSY